MTATIRAIPRETSCQKGLTPTRTRPLLSVARMQSPSTVPTIVPRPPEKLVPPMMTAVMTSSSAPRNAFDEPAPSWETLIRPASAAQRPGHDEAMKRTRATPTPWSRAASVFDPPPGYSCQRPCSGRARPRARQERGRSRQASESLRRSRYGRVPRSRRPGPSRHPTRVGSGRGRSASVPSVAMIQLIPIFVTKAPLRAPIDPPMRNGQERPRDRSTSRRTTARRASRRKRHSR